jgi:hypothetical protein
LKLTRLSHSKFKQFKVSITLTVRNVISNILDNTDPEYCKGWAVTEVTELGSGAWKKVCLATLYFPRLSSRTTSFLETLGDEIDAKYLAGFANHVL